jgi:DNA-binding MarR family transcriptional regulator
MAMKDRKFSPDGKDRGGRLYVGALLRRTYQATRERTFKALMERGMTDLNPALLNVFVYPPPDGVRPTELADRLNMTKQALNYLLGQLESLGYIERRTGRGSRRLVFLTRRGWQVFETQWETLQTIENEWSAILGAKRFDELMDALRQLSSLSPMGSKTLIHNGDGRSQSVSAQNTLAISTRRRPRSVGT